MFCVLVAFVGKRLLGFDVWVLFVVVCRLWFRLFVGGCLDYDLDGYDLDCWELV